MVLSGLATWEDRDPQVWLAALKKELGVDIE